MNKKRHKKNPQFEPYSLDIHNASLYINIGMTRMRDLINKGIIKVSEPLKPIKSLEARKSKYVIKTEDLRKLVDENVIESEVLSKNGT